MKATSEMMNIEANTDGKTFREAFVQGRLKKRHLLARGTTRVWIEPDRAGIA